MSGPTTVHHPAALQSVKGVAGCRLAQARESVKKDVGASFEEQKTPRERMVREGGRGAPRFAVAPDGRMAVPLAERHSFVAANLVRCGKFGRRRAGALYRGGWPGPPAGSGDSDKTSTDSSRESGLSIWSAWI